MSQLHGGVVVAAALVLVALKASCLKYCSSPWQATSPVAIYQRVGLLGEQRMAQNYWQK